MIDNENNNISYRLLINDKLLVYILSFNGIFIILSFLLIYFLSYSIITSICSLIIVVTIGILMNYFTLTKKKLVMTKGIIKMNDDLIDEIEEFQTIMK
jgi:hypothetical protein